MRSVNQEGHPARPWDNHHLYKEDVLAEYSGHGDVRVAQVRSGEGYGNMQNQVDQKGAHKQPQHPLDQ